MKDKYSKFNESDEPIIAYVGRYEIHYRDPRTGERWVEQTEENKG